MNFIVNRLGFSTTCFGTLGHNNFFQLFGFSLQNFLSESPSIPNVKAFLICARSCSLSSFILIYQKLLCASRQDVTPPALTRVSSICCQQLMQSSCYWVLPSSTVLFVPVLFVPLLSPLKQQDCTSLAYKQAFPAWFFDFNYF